MPFGRRDKKKLTTYIKSIFLFFISFSRTRKYISLSFQRLKGTPHELALGFSTGVAVSFTPFIGFHALISISLAWAIRGSMAAAIIGTFFGNPWTFPLIWYLTLKVGNIFYGEIFNFNNKISFVLLKTELTTLLLIFKNLFITFDINAISNNLLSLKLIPVMSIGSIPLVVVVWTAVYFLTVNIIKSYQNRKKKEKVK